MNKTIFFILDSFELYKSIYNTVPKRTLCYSYSDTEEAIQNNMQHIVTYDIGHLSFDLEDLGQVCQLLMVKNFVRDII